MYGGLEVIDSRYRDFRLTLPDVLADNASSGRFVTGPVATSPCSLDLGLEACLLELNGQVVDSAIGAAVQGHPAEALVLAANDLGRRGRAIEPRWIVLTGGMTDAVAVAPDAILAALHPPRLAVPALATNRDGGKCRTGQPSHVGGPPPVSQVRSPEVGSERR